MFGFGSALKASVTPRIGSRGAISTPAKRDALMVMLPGDRGYESTCEFYHPPSAIAMSKWRRVAPYGKIAGCCIVQHPLHAHVQGTPAAARSARAGARSSRFPDSPFRLHQTFAPAGDQPEAIEKLTEGVRDGLAYQTLLGVTGSGKTYTMAHVIARLGCPALILAPNKTLAAQLYSEMREFFPENAVEYFVSYYDYYQPEAYVPSKDLYIEKDSSINEHIEQMRLSATKSLLERRDTIIVARSPRIYGIGDPVDYHGMILHLREREKLTPARRDPAPVRDAVRAQRLRVPARHLPRARRRARHLPGGELRDRGARDALRRRGRDASTLFDPLTGQMLQRVPRYTVYPSSHYVTPRATTLRAIEAIKAELRERIEFFQKHGKLVEAQRIEQRTRFDLEMLNEMGFCKGIENYSRHLSGRSAGRAAADADRLPAAATR